MGDNVITAGNWYKIDGVYDGRIGSLYINGVKQTATRTVAPNVSNLSLKIGAYYANDPVFIFPGLIDEVKIWNYARSGEQIQNDYIRNSKGLK